MDTRLSSSFRGDFTGTRLVFVFLLFKLAFNLLIIAEEWMGAESAFLLFETNLGGRLLWDVREGNCKGKRELCPLGADGRFGVLEGTLLSCFFLSLLWDLPPPKVWARRRRVWWRAIYLNQITHAYLATYLPTYLPTITCVSWDGLRPS